MYFFFSFSDKGGGVWGYTARFWRFTASFTDVRVYLLCHHLMQQVQHLFATHFRFLCRRQQKRQQVDLQEVVEGLERECMSAFPINPCLCQVSFRLSSFLSRTF